ncbi:MAG: hypothetical protein H8D05_01620 [FCB group bacterium]|nr:hypothetical protein [FCB group bacterium]
MHNPVHRVVFVLSCITLVLSCGGPEQIQAELTLGEPTGNTIKNLMGVNAGPVSTTDSTRSLDVTAGYREIGINLIRTNDYYGAFDMCVMYPDQSADPSNSQSYNFTESDRVFSAIIEGGFIPYIRLGNSWGPTDNFNPPFPRIPDNFENWSLATVEIVRRYSDTLRWGNDIKLKYVEIWNEPNSQAFWNGTTEEFCRLYATTAVLLKSEFPDLMIGGPGFSPQVFASPAGKFMPVKFLTYIRDNNIPLDFISWHIYTNDPIEFANAAHYYDSLAGSLEFSQVEFHNTEWSTLAALEDPQYQDLKMGGLGASIITGIWITMQDVPLNIATIYRGNEPLEPVPVSLNFGLFDTTGTPRRMALAMNLWGRMVLFSEIIEISITGVDGSEIKGISCIAGTNEIGQIAILIANSTANDIVIGQLPECILKENRFVVFEVNDESSEIQIESEPDNHLEISSRSVVFIAPE